MRLLALVLLSSLLALSSGCAPSRSNVSASALFGVEARRFLTSPFVVEVRPAKGSTPDQKALSVLLARAQEVASGPIALVVDREAPDAFERWTQDDLLAFERRYRMTPGSLFVVWAGGRSVLGAQFAGETYSPHGIAVYPDGRPVEMPEALVHEFGHVLGLVRSARADRAHPFHDVDPKCVMFYRTTGATTFCDYCKGDLAASR